MELDMVDYFKYFSTNSCSSMVEHTDVKILVAEKFTEEVLFVLFFDAALVSSSIRQNALGVYQHSCTGYMRQ